VINFDFPEAGVEDYVHRIGRTARGTGSKGTSYTFLANKNLKDARCMTELVGVLARCDQEIPEVLARIAESASRGSGGFNDRSSSRSRYSQGGRGSGGGDKFGLSRGGGDRFGGGGGGRFGNSSGFGGGRGGGDRYGGGGDRFGGDRLRGGDRFGGGGGDRFGGDPRGFESGGGAGSRSQFGEDRFAPRGGRGVGGDRPDSYAPRSASPFGGRRGFGGDEFPPSSSSSSSSDGIFGEPAAVQHQAFWNAPK
jgi:hypothetical protein